MGIRELGYYLDLSGPIFDPHQKPFVEVCANSLIAPSLLFFNLYHRNREHLVHDAQRRNIRYLTNTKCVSITDGHFSMVDDLGQFMSMGNTDGRKKVDIQIVTSTGAI